MSSPNCANIDVIEVISERSRLAFISPLTVKSLLTTYFRHEIRTLRASEAWAHPDFLRLAQDDLLPDVQYTSKSQQTKVRGLARTTGKHIMDNILWDDIHDIVLKLSEKAVPVSGIRYPGRYVYVLAVWCGQEDPSAEHNAVYPEVKFKHIEAALRAFIKELQVFL